MFYRLFCYRMTYKLMTDWFMAWYFTFKAVWWTSKTHFNAVSWQWCMAYFNISGISDLYQNKIGLKHQYIRYELKYIRYVFYVFLHSYCWISGSPCWWTHKISCCHSKNYVFPFLWNPKWDWLALNLTAQEFDFSHSSPISYVLVFTTFKKILSRIQAKK